jgi:hypothetical protein
MQKLAPAGAPKSTTFQLSFAGAAAFKAHVKRHGDLDHALDWDRIQTPRIPGQRLWAAQAWLRSAFNEYHSAALMNEMLAHMIREHVPLDLCTMASEFPGHELVHAELCARLSLALGGANAIDARPPTHPELDPDLSELERCHQLVIRLCAVGENLSFGWLSSMARPGTQPVIKAVLRRLLKDEALHQAFGWRYLDWALPSMDDAQRARLMRAVAEDLRPYSQPAVGAEAPDVVALHEEMGLLTAQEAAAIAHHSARGVLDALARRGLVASG